MARFFVEHRGGRESVAQLVGPGSERAVVDAAHVGLVKVPAGKFTMGSNDGGVDEKPIHEVHLDAFWIDRTEVTVEAYRKCVDAGGCAAAGTGRGCNWRDVTDGGCDPENFHREERPVNCVDWNQAVGYCSWAGERLPTEAEWEKAARGVDGRTYPWGNAPASRAYAVMDDGGDDRDADSTRPVGSLPRGRSPYGALDMAGNVWEWVSDWYAKDYYASTPFRNPSGPSSGTQRVVRGGAWDDHPEGVRASIRDQDSPTVSSYDVGFRCARDW